jgi:hypothetical protein
MPSRELGMTGKDLDAMHGGRSPAYRLAEENQVSS